MTYDYVATNEELEVYIKQMLNGTLDKSLDYTMRESFKQILGRE